MRILLTNIAVLFFCFIAHSQIVVLPSYQAAQYKVHGTISITTTAASNITQTSAVSGGIITHDGGATITARGVCWSTTQSPTVSDPHSTDGSGVGTFTSTISGLTSGTTYYVRAYATNTVGTAYGNNVTFTTLAAFSCGYTITVSHIAGEVSPVNKATTYGTVTNIAGEPTKCWISSNLGSDHQATAVNDATEASAGWYWQFNRKQGYKHDGTTRIPNTAWISSISENSDWTLSNDPCALELGTGWRMPTLSEWTNVDASGNWSGLIDIWNSGLKMHAAGTIDNSGSLLSRGNGGYYMSSTQNNADIGWFLYALAGSCQLSSGNKAYAYSLRCLTGGSTTTPTVTTSSVLNISQTSANSGGNVTSDGGATVTARGVCWSTTQSPTIADPHTTDGTGTGTFTSTISGLTTNTTYYVRAYATNSVGTAYGNTVTLTTLAAFSCGTTITVSHIAGDVAPVTKTTTYGTVTNIPGEPSKCWITSNLGSDHQATAVNDATEASAGWYWQFNRKQGFKHDGTNRTPSTVWINIIDENSDWITANDPCAIELGNGWRLPTYAEWYNVDYISNWTNWNDIWNSNLKMHAAGSLDSYDGTLNSRGSYAYYWSNKQNGPNTGWHLLFYYSSCFMNNFNKARGFSIRCAKDVSSSATTPTVTTSSATNVTQTSLVSGGIVTNDGGAAVTARGVCWSSTQSPTTADPHTTDGSGIGTFTSTISGLATNTTYYVRAYAANSVGTAYGNLLTVTTILSIGDSYAGGKVAYILQPGDPGYIVGEVHGLISSLNNLSGEWGCYTILLPGADGTAIGTGYQNTIDIVSSCLTNNIAAKICYDLVVGGYEDWFLPSIDELGKLYLNKTAIGGFTEGDYWSSSEGWSGASWAKSFGTGAQGTAIKYYQFHVRAVRSF